MNLFAAGNRQRKTSVQGDDKASIRIECQNKTQKRLEYLFEPFLYFIKRDLEHLHLSFIINLDVIRIGDL